MTQLAVGPSHVLIPADVADIVFNLARSRSLHNPVTPEQQAALDAYRRCLPNVVPVKDVPWAREEVSE